jgi:hypothetical protein
MKDIIYPTIKKQFDKLTPEWRSDYDYYNFIDDKGNSHLHYYGDNPDIYVSIDFFYLNYFGVKEEVFNKPVANIFIDLVKQSLGSEFEPIRKIRYKDVFFMYDNNF